jgi:nucleoside 2-deoxyribosyltransferase
VKIYLAHPITGLSPDEVFAYYDAITALLGREYEVLHPMLGKGHFRGAAGHFMSDGYQHPVSSNHAIVERDLWMVTQADVVLVDLTGTKRVSIGCTCELAWAHQLRRHTVVVMEAGNVHEHAFTFECADVLVGSLAAAVKYLREVRNGGEQG